MRGPLVILALLSICGGWIGIERFGGFLAPSAAFWLRLLASEKSGGRQQRIWN
jgi:hypothetical protein